jgi:ribosomal protein S18 acetylase RimI-like enzyme
MAEIVRVSDAEAIETAAGLAREIWYEHYIPVIGRAQVDYMVSKFQSVAAITEQIAGGLDYFLISNDGRAEGYFAIQSEPEERSLFLSKFYIRKAIRGRGLGRAALAFIESSCRAGNLDRIWLTVNKHNPAIATYEKLGFRTTGEIVADIGNGFVMDDYRMEKLVGPSEQGAA